MLLNTFHQSIAHLNDSSNFESSFEVKYIPTNQNFKNRCMSQSDREALMRFVEEFEALQFYNTSAKSTPKKSSPSTSRSGVVNSLHAPHDGVISGNITIPSLTQSPEVIRNHVSHLWQLDDDFLMDQHHKSSRSITSTRSTSPVLFRSSMGCKSLTCCENPNIEDDGIRLMDSNPNSTSDPAIYLHPPLLPTFTITPPTKSNRGAGSELAKFFRSSFRVKRANIAYLNRSISVDEGIQVDENIDEAAAAALAIASTTTSKKAVCKAKKKILEDTTNCHTNGNEQNVSKY